MLPVPVQSDRIADFCRTWKVTELSLFGSVLRDDFGPASDVDILLAFEPGTVWDLDHYDHMREQLADIFGRPVDIVLKRALRNPFLRHSILTGKKVLYAA